MPPEERKDEIKRDIEDFGHKITNIWNIKKRGTKAPLNMFYVELKPEKNNKDIYQTTHVLRYRVTFDPPHPKREIPQCINCDTVIQKAFAIVRRDASNVQEIIRPLAVHETLNLRMSSASCAKEITYRIIKAA